MKNANAMIADGRLQVIVVPNRFNMFPKDITVILGWDDHFMFNAVNVPDGDCSGINEFGDCLVGRYLHTIAYDVLQELVADGKAWYASSNTIEHALAEAIAAYNRSET